MKRIALICAVVLSLCACGSTSTYQSVQLDDELSKSQRSLEKVEVDLNSDSSIESEVDEIFNKAYNSQKISYNNKEGNNEVNSLQESISQQSEASGSENKDTLGVDSKSNKQEEVGIVKGAVETPSPVISRSNPTTKPITKPKATGSPVVTPSPAATNPPVNQPGVSEPGVTNPPVTEPEETNEPIMNEPPEITNPPVTEPEKTDEPIINEPPVVTNTPSVGNSENSGNTDEPSSPVEPGITDEPISTDEPSSPLEPGNVGEPEVTEEPDSTIEPDSTVKPSSSPESSETIEPGETAEPSEIVEPSETVEPDTTVKPGETVEPSETVKPDEVVEPSETVKPDETVKPGEVVEPDSTSEPDVTEPSTTPDPGIVIEPSTSPEPSTVPGVEEPGKDIPDSPEEIEKPDIYDIVLFFGQSNSNAWCNTKQPMPADFSNIHQYSLDSGIDEDILSWTVSTSEVRVPVLNNTAFIYKYLANTFDPITSNTVICGDGFENSGYIGDIYENSFGGLKYNPETGLLEQYHVGDPYISIQTSPNQNMIPEFCRQYYEFTGHKVIAVTGAVGGAPIECFLPADDPDNYYNIKGTRQHYLYEGLVENFNSAVNLAKESGYEIGGKYWIVFQGEANLNTESQPVYYDRFIRVKNNMARDIGTTMGAIVYSSNELGSYNFDNTMSLHRIQERLVNENLDIILGSSFDWDMYIPAEEIYNSDAFTTRVFLDEFGNKLPYSVAFDRAKKLTSYEYNFYETDQSNIIHFLSCSLSQIGRDCAESFAKELGFIEE